MSWIFYTLAAAILQTFRNLEQKNLNKKLDILTTSWARFLLPLPFGIIIVACSISHVSHWLIFYSLVTSIFQSAGNVFLLKTLKSKNFSIGIAFYKTEMLQAMIVGFLVFGEQISLTGFIAIIVTTIGVILMSGLAFKNGLKEFIQSLKNEAVLYGLLSGFCFAISAFNLKFASESLFPLGYSNIKASVIVLMWVIVFQISFFLQSDFIRDVSFLI